MTATCKNGTTTVTYMGPQGSQDCLTYLALNGGPIVSITQYQYFPNGSYSIAFSNGILSIVPPRKMPAFSLYLWSPLNLSFPPGTSSPQTTVSHLCMDMGCFYQFDDRGGFGYFWSGNAWTYGQ